MIYEHIFQVRGGEGVGPFNTNFNVKLIFLIITLSIVIYDCYTQKRKDYYAVLNTGTIIWSIVELTMQLAGIREFQAAYLFGWELPIYLQIPFQGLVEGAMVAVVCLFVGDRIVGNKENKKKRYGWILLFALIMVYIVVDALDQGIQTPAVGGEVGVDITSRRAMTSPTAIIFLSCMVAIDIVFYIKTKKSAPALRKRVVIMTWLMIIFGAVWTISEVIAGTRWIEIGTFTNSVRATPLIEFIFLSYDVVIEIALAYVPFIAIPYFLGDIDTGSEPIISEP